MGCTVKLVKNLFFIYPSSHTIELRFECSGKSRFHVCMSCRSTEKKMLFLFTNLTTMQQHRKGFYLCKFEYMYVNGIKHGKIFQHEKVLVDLSQDNMNC